MKAGLPRVFSNTQDYLLDLDLPDDLTRLLPVLLFVRFEILLLLEEEATQLGLIAEVRQYADTLLMLDFEISRSSGLAADKYSSRKSWYFSDASFSARRERSRHAQLSFAEGPPHAQTKAKQAEVRI